MSLRPPSAGASAAEAAFDALGHEILAEKAAALGRAGQRVEETLAKLRDNATRTATPAAQGGCRGGARLFHPARTLRPAQA